MAKLRSLGTTIQYLPAYNSAVAPVAIGSLTSIGELACDSDELDVTTLDSASGFREFLQGYKDSGEIPLNGFHNPDATGHDTCRALYASGESGYFWVTFPDGTAVAFTAYVKGHVIGAAEVDSAIGFGLTLRVTGYMQVFAIKHAVAQEKSEGQTATMNSAATVAVGAPLYQWYSNNEENYETPTKITGKTSATYTTGALSAGTYYYFCDVSSTGHRAVHSQIHVITVT